MSLPIDYPFVTVGDATPITEAWRFDGFNDENTDRGRVYFVTANVGGEVQFSGYSDRDKTALVVQGQAAVGSRATLAEQNNSGLSGSVKVLANAVENITVFVALATQKDLERREDRVSGLLGEDPFELDFSAIYHEVMREFYTNIQATFPPPSYVGDPLNFPGTAPVVTQGNRGMPEVHALFLWYQNGEGDWELKGLENPGDWRTWAILYSLHLIWDRKARSGDDNIQARADRFLEDARRAWKKVPVMIDSDGDQVPERTVHTRTMYLERG